MGKFNSYADCAVDTIKKAIVTDKPSNRTTPDDMKTAIAQSEAAGISMVMDGAGFGPDDDGHYAYLDTEKYIGTTIELIQRPKGRREPEKIYPVEEN